ncbi:MFS general substrate transporter [Aaosphaeria arxii CBS 175.79]|uniref:MFS general substrate transporter n=1 Tax=Aaosphaeria arxii CBS 175.79 TaxID=1450172 RepID=A0A6A5XTJ1_9PLEO|nr:MFS general substrate transporter [Aaosphaeria arxii CBS 175.79]KAF2016618.1 MFS general substrate transporter [Aaosphaeria arxii CBS 175.79]
MPRDEVASTSQPAQAKSEEKDVPEEPEPPTLTDVEAEIPYTIFTIHEKRFMTFILTFASLFSPISSTIYYPALSPLAEELHVTDSAINVTITTFMIFQGLAPAFIGAFSDAEGRRPAYLICFIVYIAADVGLALQGDYAALLVLRCVQSSGSSGTVALANAVVADFAMSFERGKWMGWANAGGLLGPTIGPVIGGLLTQYLGWRSIFWFLAIFAFVYLIPIVLFFPESCRAVVGNGSRRPPSKWNQCLLDPIITKRIASNPSTLSPPIPPHRLRFPNPFKALLLIFSKDASLLLFSSAVMFAGFYAFMAIIPSQFESKYGFNSLHIGLCYLPSGVGGTMAALIGGRLMDVNFQRHARKQGLDASDTRRIRTLTTFPIEAARLEIAIPLIVLGSLAIVAFGWVMRYPTHLAGPLILLFVVGFCCTGAFTILMTLVVDIYPEKPATAVAASNMTRCWLGGGATAAVVPLVRRIGMGWAFTLCGGLWLALCPLLVLVVRWGPEFRREKARAREGGE